MTNRVEEFIAVNFFNNMDEAYTCPCGVYVHPKRRNWDAIHIDDCVYYIEPIEHEHNWKKCLDCDVRRGDFEHSYCTGCGIDRGDI